MCGICGIVKPRRGESVSEELLAALCRTIVHRGPDDQGLFVEGPVGLGTRRLSIIDLVTGHQPLSNEDGSVWVAYNGEIYNFPELREELLGRGHAFRTRSDTETIAHGYEEWGDACVERFRGMFAFAVWDKAKGRVFIGRDRLGIKPLYYTLLEDRTLVFGSELKAVIAHPGVRRRLNPRALDLYLTLEYIPAPHTIFEGIYKLPAGHTLSSKDGAVEVKKYWDIEGTAADAAGAEARQPPRLEEAMDRLYGLLKESVKLRLISDVPLGAFLSGGIDSSTIVGLMRELGASPLKTFSIGFKDQSYNELEYARTIARRFETDHEELVLDPQALDLTDKLIRHLDEPFGDFSIFPTYLVSEMARAKVTVALSGDGGDEVFGGYEHYQAQALARLPLVAAGARLAGPAVRRLRPAPEKKGAKNKLRRFVQGFEHPSSARHLRWMMFQSARSRARLYTPALKAELGGIKDIGGAEPFEGVYARLDALDRINRELYLDLKTYLPDDILVKVDRMSMAVSLEARVPLLDHKLVEYAYTLPGSWKVHGLTTKWLFKKTVERLLPKDNIYKKKEGFSIPIKHWLMKELKELLLDTLSEERIREGGLFEYAAVRRMIGRHLQGRENHSHELWSLLVFELWRARYL
jgi:asparagine synthase (glutamine-hydrolysing)